jgi:hypothetical protein
MLLWGQLWSAGGHVGLYHNATLCKIAVAFFYGMSVRGQWERLFVGAVGQVFFFSFVWVCA